MLVAAVVLGLSTSTLQAQEVIQTLPAPATVVPGPTMPVVPAAPAALTFDDCLQLAFQKQPALAAARATLASAEAGRRALDNLPFYAKCLARDLPVRKQQACYGVTIAQAALWQAEWETRYAVTRNYYTVIYIRTQLDLLDEVLAKLQKGRKTAADVLKGGEPGKVTTIDLDIFDVNIELLKARGAEAKAGLPKAVAALREAVGVGPDYPLEVAGGTLPALVPALDRDQLVQLALANRGEVTQVTSANRVTELEIAAQASKHFSLNVPTFASGSDIHAQPIPQGVSNGEYRPGAIGLEMPPFLVGRKDDRVARAADLNQRAGAVVDKTVNLVALEAENYYLKWAEAKDRLEKLNAARPRAVEVADKIDVRLREGNATANDYVQATTLLDQIRAQTNEALYLHSLALAALERITAGGFRINPAKHP
jgi:outer membrane protein TolC